MEATDVDHGKMGHGSPPAETKGAKGGRRNGSALNAEEMAFRVTRPQLVAVAMLSVLALIAGLLFSASYANLGIGARDVDGAVMAPGMIMTRDMPAAAMRDMAAVDPGDVTYQAPPDARGDQPIEPRLEGDVKVFDLSAEVITWNILSYERMFAYAINGQVPGPRIRLTEGDRIRINVTNHLPQSTTLHWHGLIVPNQFDGPAEVTQEPIEPGETYTYEFTVSQAGTFFYHSHDHADRQQALGLYGALIIDPADGPAEPDVDQEVVIQLQEWLEREGWTYPAMPMEGAMPNFFTINGKAYPDTDTIRAEVGDRLLIRFIGSNSAFIHPMHVHGGPFTIVATDGVPVPDGARFEKDTVNVGPGERYDVIWTAREPGKWLLHCHINHHTTNDNVEEEGAGGLTMIIEVSGEGS
ncbi:MAG: copper oxidase [Chloroflexi bacterium]|nr:copper oxidase [Chloroflexota bacterium]